MEINLVKLLEYFKERIDTTITIDTRDNEPCLIFTKGHYSENGSVTITRTFKNLEQILTVNSIFDRIKEVNEDDTLDYVVSRVICNDTREKKIDDLIYDTLAKYILQMLCASQGVKYADITPLEIDKDYFRPLKS